MDVTVRANFGDSKREISQAELSRAAEKLGLQALVPGRFSTVLVMELLNLIRQGISEHVVLSEIMALEAGTGSATKAATPFRNPELARANLWHKHFFAPTLNMLATNIETELRGKAGIGRTVESVFGSIDGAPTEQDFSRLSHALFVEPFLQRFNRRAMTGEWLVYSPRSSGNLYLGACSHTTGDAGLIDRLAIWEREFDVLIAPAGAS